MLTESHEKVDLNSNEKLYVQVQSCCVQPSVATKNGVGADDGSICAVNFAVNLNIVNLKEKWGKSFLF